MKKLSIRLKQAIVLIMILMMTLVSCFALTGCNKTDSSADDSNEVVQFEEEETIEEEPDDLITP